MFDVATSAPIVVTIDGRQVTLAKPKRKLLGELYAVWVEQDRQALVRALDDAGVTGEERKTTLLKFLVDSRLASYPLGCLFEFGRAVETLQKAGVPEEVIDALDDAELLRVAMRMWGFKPVVKNGEGEDPKAESQSPATGS
mgnify:FL=1